MGTGTGSQGTEMRIAPYVHVTVNRPWASMMARDGRWGRFENLPHLIAGRWGWWLVLFGCVVVEIGSRNSGNRVGKFLKRHGWWKW